MFSKETFNAPYGNDQIGSLFKCDNLLKRRFRGKIKNEESAEDEESDEDEECTCFGWGLSCLPQKGHLKYLQNISPGVNSPMLYVASCFSTFCWHNEDNHLSAINYEHQGSTRTWYAISNNHVDDFYKVAKCITFSGSPVTKVSRKSVIMKNTMISPVVFAANQIPVCKVVQGPGDFIITGPAVHHAGFSHGFAICEAVNFAPTSWLPWGLKYGSLYREMKRLPVIPVKLVSTLLASDLKASAVSYPKELSLALHTV